MKILDPEKRPSFIKTFCHIMEDSEVPPEFAKWTAITLLGALLGKDVYMEHAFKKIHANLYVFLFGSSGIKKNTAIDILTDKIPDNNKLLILKGGVSWPGIYDEIWEERDQETDEAKPVLVVTPEMSVHWKGAGVATRIIQGLTNAAGGGVVEGDRTRMFGKKVLRNTCISVIGASTVAWLRGTFTKEDLTEGFGARIIPILADWNFDKRIANPGSNITNLDELWDYLVILMSYFLNLEGDVGLSHEALMWDQHLYTTQDSPQGNLEGALFQRRQNIWRKLALIAAVNRRGRAEEIELKDLKQGIEWGQAREINVPKLHMELSRTQDLAYLDDVLEFIRKKQETTHRHVLQRFSRTLKARDITHAEDILAEQGQIQFFNGVKGGRGLKYING